MRALLLSTIIAAAPAAAMAGDRADRMLLGFSSDGATFAFAETGVQDGSGFPYANVYFVDLAADEWAAEPIEILIEREGPPDRGAAVRAAIAQAWPLVSQLGIDTPARLLWSQPLAEAGHGDPEAHGAYPGSTLARFGEQWWNGPVTIEIEQVDMPDRDCADYGADLAGFALTAEHFGETQEIYRDRTVPKTRGCALGYTISDVVEGPPSSEAPGAPAPLVALINVYKHGFEGPDRRFIAVPLNIPDGVR